MYQELLDFARLLPLSRDPACVAPEFDRLAVELFSLQFRFNPAYRTICEARGISPRNVVHWQDIPFVSTSAFKELEITSVPPEERTAVFHSSGTTEQRPGRHFHCAESLAVYEESLWSWFDRTVVSAFRFPLSALGLVCLTPPVEQAPQSSLVHMFETVRQRLGSREGSPHRCFFGGIGADGAWTIDFDAVLTGFNASLGTRHPALLLGTAFSFVHLLDHMTERNLRFRLPEGSRVMETGGYKNRSRSMPKTELHALITERLGVPPENIICEYGMSELSSQAYGWKSGERKAGGGNFRFPPWARVQIVSPETGKEVVDGETGLIRILDLANVFSVAAVQTEDLGVRRGGAFELVGRAPLAESRGCSLMTA